jgi:hypothetical protein
MTENAAGYRKVYREKHPERNRESQRRYSERNPKQAMLRSARNRAAKKGIPFDIEIGDITIPKNCPVLDIPLVRQDCRQGDSSPSLDKEIPSLGYTKGNVRVISALANRIKQNATSDQIFKVAQYVKSIEEDSPWIESEDA